MDNYITQIYNSYSKPKVYAEIIKKLSEKYEIEEVTVYPYSRLSTGANSNWVNFYLRDEEVINRYCERAGISAQMPSAITIPLVIPKPKSDEPLYFMPVHSTKNQEDYFGELNHPTFLKYGFNVGIMKPTASFKKYTVLNGMTLPLNVFGISNDKYAGINWQFDCSGVSGVEEINSAVVRSCYKKLGLEKYFAHVWTANNGLYTIRGDIQLPQDYLSIKHDSPRHIWFAGGALEWWFQKPTNIIDLDAYGKLDKKHHYDSSLYFTNQDWMGNREPEGIYELRLTAANGNRYFIGYFNADTQVLQTSDVYYLESGWEVIELIMTALRDKGLLKEISNTPEVDGTIDFKSLLYMGSDPEFEILTKDIDAINASYIFGRDTNTTIGVDGSGKQLEFRVAPSNDTDKVVSNFKRLMNRVQHFRIGDVGDKWPCGAHLHFGTAKGDEFAMMDKKMYTVYQMLRAPNHGKAIAMFLDRYLGVPFSRFNGQGRMGSKYLNLGKYRVQPWGLEYRTLPSQIWRSPEIAKIVFKVAQNTAAFVLSTMRKKKTVNFLSTRPSREEYREICGLKEDEYEFFRRFVDAEPRKAAMQCNWVAERPECVNVKRWKHGRQVMNQDDVNRINSIVSVYKSFEPITVNLESRAARDINRTTVVVEKRDDKNINIRLSAINGDTSAESIGAAIVYSLEDAVKKQKRRKDGNT